MEIPPPKNDGFFQALLKNSIVSITNSKGIITYVNPAFCKLTGYSNDELIGKTYALLNSGVHTTEFYDFIWETITQGNTWKGELSSISKQGRNFWTDTTIVPVSNGQSKPDQFIAIYNEITHTKELIDTLKKRAHRQGLIAILGQLSSGSISIQGLLEQTIAVVSGSMDMDIGMITEFSIDGENTLLRANIGLQTDNFEKVIIPAQTDNLIGYTSKHDGPVIIENLHTERRFDIPELIVRQQASSGVSMLIGDREYPFGMMLLFSKAGKSISLDDTYFLQSICTMISGAVTRHNMETALRKERELSRKYLDIAEVMIVAIDKNENIILANQKASKILGYDQHELLGMNWFENFIPKKISDEIHDLFQSMINGIISEEELAKPRINKIITKNNTQRLIKWSNRPVYDDTGNIVSILSAGEDITELEKVAKEQKKLQHELVQAQKMEAIGMLTGGIAHDFNNILASILGFTSLAIEKFADSNEKLASYLNEIEHASTRAKEIIAQMQSLNQPDNNSLEPTTLPFLVKNILKMLRSAIPSSIEFEQQLDNEVPAVLINPTNINQVVMNLLISARDSMHGAGKLTISITTAKNIESTCLSCKQDFSGDYVQLSVSDTGKGIGKQDLDHIFDSEYIERDEDTMLAKSLRAVHRIVHESDGHILVDSELDKGTDIHLFFKVAKGKTRNSTAATPGKKITPLMTDAHIMIVDDENSVASYMGEVFSQIGFTVSVFTDATEALKSFQNAPDNYDLVLTDQTMPSITGDVLAQEMFKVKPDMPIILCTGHSDIIDEEKAMKMNFKGFLRKPIETPTLLKCVHDLLVEKRNSCF